MKPTFYIIGAPKCGTTSWAAYLEQHPMVNFSKHKELNHFSTDLRTAHNRIVTSEDEYEARFDRRGIAFGTEGVNGRSCL